jgi:hypothetical protein
MSARAPAKPSTATLGRPPLLTPYITTTSAMKRVRKSNRLGKLGPARAVVSMPSRVVNAVDSQSTHAVASQTFETQLRDINSASFDSEVLSDAPTPSATPSNAPTPSAGVPETPTPSVRAPLSRAAATAPSVSSSVAPESLTGGFDERFLDNFDDIEWGRLPEYTKPLRTQRYKKSVLYEHGYRVALRTDPSRIFFVCRYCHVNKLFGTGGVLETTSSTTSAWNHLEKQRAGHAIMRPGKQLQQLESGQLTLGSLMGSGVHVSQEVSNALGNFNQQQFRLAVVSWLAENNHPLREVETPAFRKLLRAANPEAELSTFRSHTSVSAFVVRLYLNLQPQVRTQSFLALSARF